MKYFILLMLIIAIPAVQGLGVAQDYLENNTLRLMEGEYHYVKLTLQNPEEEQVSVKLEVQNEIAEIRDKQETYNLSPKSYKTEVFLKITAPENARIGDKYKVTYVITPVAEQEGGQIGMNMRLRRSFDVLIVDENGVGKNPGILNLQTPLAFAKNNLLWIILPLVIIGVFLLIGRKSKLLAAKILNEPKLKNKKPVLEKPLENNKPEKKEQSRTEQEIPPGKYFYFHNGVNLKKIEDLQHYLQVMPQETYNKHVTNERNDFANWIEEVFNNKKLSAKIRKANSRQEMINVLQQNPKK